MGEDECWTKKSGAEDTRCGVAPERSRVATGGPSVAFPRTDDAGRLLEGEEEEKERGGTGRGGGGEEVVVVLPFAAMASWSSSGRRGSLAVPRHLSWPSCTSSVTRYCVGTGEKGGAV